MWQKADRELSTPNPSASRPDKLPDQNVLHPAFSLNRNGALCLPVLSETHRLAWVLSDQLEMLPDSAAELNAAFDRFPYLTKKEMVALAQCCSLHPDQVKVWFMRQRIHFGISWDAKDIGMVRMKMKGKEEETKRDEMKESKEVKDSDGKKGSGGKDVEVAAGEENKGNTKRKPKKRRVRKVEKKGTNQGDDVKGGEKVNVKECPQFIQTQKTKKAKANDSDKQPGSCSKPEKMPLQKNQLQTRTSVQFSRQLPAQKTSTIPDETLHASPSLPSQIPPSNVALQSDTHVQELSMMDVLPSSLPHASDSLDVEFIRGVSVTDDHFSTPAVPQKPTSVSGTSSTPQTGFNMKSDRQLEVMKLAFCNYQYPENKEYDHLALQTGIQRPAVVHWFCDQRYYIKKMKPRWMTKEQHSQALVNIQYRQYMRRLKTQAGETGSRKELEVKTDEEKLPSTRFKGDDSTPVP